ncbi:MAG: hypothetical protein K8S27_12095 [Candidatus Omnitrophica bacterium]|nr:hypothetical protein [Candidatus Omnitrophota bacterium]
MSFAFYRCCGIWVLVFILTGCSTAPVATEPTTSMMFQANAVLGKDALLLWVPAENTSRSSLSVDLANKLSAAKTKSFRICCVGPKSSNTMRVILDALDMHLDPLPGLQILFIGDEKHKEPVRQAVKKLGGRFYFNPL